VEGRHFGRSTSCTTVEANWPAVRDPAAGLRRRRADELVVKRLAAAHHGQEVAEPELILVGTSPTQQAGCFMPTS
jgi:hypothetical protein